MQCLQRALINLDTMLLSLRTSSARGAAMLAAAVSRLIHGGSPWHSTRTSSPKKRRRPSSPRSAWPRSASTPSSSPSTCCTALVDQEDGVVPAVLEKLGVQPRDVLQQRSSRRSAALPRGRRPTQVYVSPRVPARVRTPPRRRPSGSRTTTSRPSTSCWRWPTTGDGRGRPAPARSWASRRDRVYQALQEVRGGQRVTTPEPRDDLPVAGAVRPRPDRSWPAQGKLDPVIGRDEEIRRIIQVLVAADQEQPGPDRRAGRRQDRHRRGPGPAHRARRRARGPEGQAHRRARPGRAGGRRQVPRRVRGAAEGRAQGSHRLRTARSSCSSTSCTPSSARARPRARWTPRTCSSRCSPAASCTASARPRSTSTASTSRRTPRWSGASSRSSSASRSVEDTISILRGLRERYEQHHKVRIKDSALVAAAVLSPPLHRRPLPARQGDRPGRRGRRRSCAWRRPACRSSWTRSGGGSCSSRSSARGCARRRTRPRKERLERHRAGAGRPQGAGRRSSRRSWQRELDQLNAVGQLQEQLDADAHASSSRRRCAPTGSARRACKYEIAQLEQQLAEAERGAARAQPGRPRAGQGGGRRAGHRRGRQPAGPASRSASCWRARSRS